jgi:hypothetical protein
MKTRTASQETANLGVTAVQHFCDRHNFIFQAIPREDYGVDCYIEIALERSPRNFLVAIQIKTGVSYFRNEDESSFRVALERDDVEYWLISNMPVLFACYHPERNRLYVKHVQAEIAARSGSPWTIDHLCFDKEQDEASDATAEYLRKLVKTTPNELDRRNIATTTAPLLVTPTGAIALDSRELKQRSPRGPLDLAQALGIEKPVRAGFLSPERQSRVLGFSADDAWVATLVVNPVGQKCDDTYLRLLSLEDWREINFPLSTEADYDTHDDGLLPAEIFERRTARAQLAATERHLLPAVGTYRHYDSKLRPGERSGISLEFGADKFEFEVRLSNGRCSVVVRADRFLPPREAVIVAEQVDPGRYFVPENNQEPWPVSKPKTFASICELAVSQSGDLLALGLFTNAEHGCWGNCEVHHVFIRLRDIRQMCIDALRT